MLGAHDTDTVSSLAGRLARLNKQLQPADHARITEKTGGVPLTAIVNQLLNAIDPDAIEAKAVELARQPAGTDPGDIPRPGSRERPTGGTALHKVFAAPSTKACGAL